MEIAQAITRHDDQLEELINEAMDVVERDTPYVAAEADYTMQYDCWPVGSVPIKVPVKPVLSIESVKYYDVNDSQQTLAPADYRFDDHRVWPVIWRADLHVDWPSLSGNRPQAVEVAFKAGHATIAALRGNAIWMRQAALARLSMLWHDRGLGTVDYERASRVYTGIIDRYRSTVYA